MTNELIKWLDKNIIMVLIIIFIFSIITPEPIIDDDKKEAIKIPGLGGTAKATLTLGAGSLLLMRLGGFFGALGPIGWGVIGITTLIFLGPSLIGNWADVFAPTPTIPGWIWVGAFLVIIFMLISRKRQ